MLVTGETFIRTNYNERNTLTSYVTVYNNTVTVTALIASSSYYVLLGASSQLLTVELFVGLLYGVAKLQHRNELLNPIKPRVAKPQRV